MTAGEVLILCLVFSGAALALMFWVAHAYWTTEVSVATLRVERACDAIMSLIAFLVPATLGLTTWLFEKLNRPWYTAFLGAATVWFLFVLAFTMYMRFNFLWRHGSKMLVGGNQGFRFVYWLITAMFGLVIGIILLGVPVFWISLKTPGRATRADSQIRLQSNQKRGRTENSTAPSRSAPKAPPGPD